MNMDSHDPRITKILQLVSQLVGCNPDENRQPGAEESDHIDCLLEALPAFVRKHSQRRTEREEVEARMVELKEAVAAITSLDFSRKVPVTSEDNVFDAIAMGLNTLVEDLERAVSKTYFKNILQSMAASLVTSDLDGNITLVNASACQLLGYQEEELLGRPIKDLFVEPVNINTDDSGMTDVKERTVIAKNGHHLPVSYSRSDLRTMQGQREGFICVLQDISEQNRVAKALRESEERFRGAFVNANIGVCLVSLEGRYLKVNDALCRIFGYSRDELEQMCYQDITFRDDQAFSEQARQKVLVSEPGQIKYAKRYIHKQGQIIWAEVASSLICDTEGNPSYFITHVRDVTKQRLAEDALRASEAQAREFQEKLKGLQAISLELAGFESPEQLCRRAIELGHSILGYDRIGLLLFENAERSRVSAFGIESTGELRVEHGLSYNFEKEPAHRVLTNRELVFVNENAELGDFTCIVGRGWNVITGIWDTDTSIGWLAADNLFEQKPLIPYQIELLKLYGLALGQLLIRKRAEADLRVSAARYRALIESQMDLISRYRPDTTLTFVNDAYCQFYGKTREELIGSNLLSMVAPKFQASVREETEMLVKDPKLIVGEYLNYGGDGKEYWIQWAIQGIVDENGRVFELQAVGRDITPLKQVEAALRTSEARLREAQQVAHVGSWDWNLATNEFYTSEEILRIYGFHPEEVKLDYTTFRQKVHPDDQALLDQSTNRAFAGQQYPPINHRIVRPDGEVRWVEQRGHLILNEQGEAVRIFGTTQDITEHKQAEDAIQQLNKELEKRVLERTVELEVANEEIRNFAYIVSHDLRAPLINLKGFAAELRLALNDVAAVSSDVLPLIDQTRRETMQRALQDSIPEALQYIESSVTHMDGFTRAILRLSRLGRQQLEFVVVDVRSVVEKILETLAFQINDQKVQVTLDSLPTVIADLVSIEQIFANILTNAVMYLLPGRPGQIEIRAESTIDETIFRVRDNGRGIAPEDMSNVFAPFRRAGKQDVPGEGMGLAYVQTLVRRHGGRIWCESEPGVGTTFTFTISRRLITDTDRASAAQTH